MSENLLLVGKFSTTSAKFGVKYFVLGKNKGKIAWN